MTAWIEAWNADPKPFVWVKIADEILDNLAGGIMARQSAVAHWRMAAGTVLAAAAATSAGLVGFQSPAAAIPTATLTCQSPQTNTVGCTVTTKNLGRHWSIVWNVNGVDDVGFDNETSWFDSCLAGDPYLVTVTVHDRTGSYSDWRFFNCQGNG